MDRIIINISKLSKDNWVIIYNFIKSIVYNVEIGSKEKTLKSMKQISNGLQLKSALDPTNAPDIYSLYNDGEDLSIDRIETLASDTCFSILYQKVDDSEDFTELVPFLLLQHEFGDAISLGINIGQLELEKQKSYKFKCSDFFILCDTKKPRLGNRSLYFVNEKDVNKETGELINIRISSFAGKSEKETINYIGKPSRRFLPLIIITEDNYKNIFGNTKGDSKELKFINESIEKIRDEWEDNSSYKWLWPQLKKVFSSSDSLFSQWFECGYFYSYGKDLKKIKSDKIEGIRNTLEIYKNSILELVQNIIFHGGKRGLLYCIYDKKENISDSYKDSIANFNEYEKDDRFLRVGIYDFGETGIIDTFKKNNSKSIQSNYADVNNGSILTLNDFFDTSSLITKALTQLDIRYAARLGIKTFVKTIIEHKGFFSVESNVLVKEGNVKKSLTTVLKDNVPTLNYDDKSYDFAHGTHYEIILPVNPSKIFTSVPLQQISLLNADYEKSFKNLSYQNQIHVYNLLKTDLDCINNSLSKEEQIKHISLVGNKLIKDLHKRDTNEIVLNMNGYKSDALNSIFKLTAYLQLNVKNGLKRIIIVNTTDLFVNEFYGKVNKIAVPPIWNNDIAIILISENLYSKIIWGKTKEEFLYINKEFQKRYFNNFYLPESSHEIPTIPINDNHTRKLVDSLISPLYDILICIYNKEEEANLSLFEYFVYKLLKRKIGPSGLGFLVNHENTYIGNKIIVKNYYEADMMFQNNFFTERFAYLIANNIRKELNIIKRIKCNIINRKKLLLIGYKHYSEYLLKAIKKVLDEENKHPNENNYSNVCLCILYDEKDSLANERFVFTFDIDFEDSEDNIQNEIKNNPDSFYYASIVPIGATLSTNDKIVGLFKKEFCPNMPDNNGNFIYNHCVIVVRDGRGEKASKLEIEQRWSAEDKGISLHDRFINTVYENVNRVHYNILISGETKSSNEKREVSCGKDNINWERRLNNFISFPNKWWREEYVNFTENSSINSQNLMGFPNVNIDNKESEMVREMNHEKELDRLYKLKDDVYKGHIEVLNCHHKYYINTEMFVKREKNNALKQWLKELKGNKNNIFNHNYFNVIVTPNVERDSDFVCAVNSFIFDDSALIIYLDVNNWRNNMVYKLSFLKGLHKNGNIKYHYVDHAFLMGETYHKSRRYLLSIIGKLTDENGNVLKNHSRPNDEQKSDFSFQSIITIINRLPYAKYQEIKKDVNDNMFAYVNLYYPTSRQGEDNCELCKLMNYYKELTEKTVLDSCISVINKNLDKIQIKQKKNITKEMNSKRNFLRLVMTHEFYYRIAEITHQCLDNSSISNRVYSDVVEELNGIYTQFSNLNSIGNSPSKFPKSKIKYKIDDWFLPKCYNMPKEEEIMLHNYYIKKLDIDKKISFLKVISSLPLSQYITIRKYAHEKLLLELERMISITNDNQVVLEYDDLKIVKSIIKSLSFLKSNALVRKDVIVGIWKILKNVVEKQNIEDEKSKLKNILQLINEQKLILKGLKQNYEDKRRYPDLFDNTEYKDKIIELDASLISVEMFCDELENDLKSMHAQTIIQDFSKDIQFYIKNSIVDDDAKATFLGELLRTGEEIKDFSGIRIKNTILSMKKNRYENPINHLFSTFQNDDILSKEYTYFLVWLFYDNTTIIRKTLDNFTKEIYKMDKIGIELNSYFYEKKGNEKKLIDFDLFVNNKQKVYNILNNKVKSEYYYLSFKPYLENEDRIDFVEKLIYVLYAKLKLEDLSTKKHLIEDDTRCLMEIFAAIMEADAAFWTMKKTNNVEFNIDAETAKDFHIYPVSFYDKSGKNKWDYNMWNLADSYYTYQMYLHKNQYPLMNKYCINPSQGEKRDLGKQSLGVYTISDNRLNNKKYNIVASITFLYDELTNGEKKFRIIFQESGKMLLLLKNNINKYVFEYLLQEKGFELWEKIHLSSRRFEKIYANSSHVFNQVYPEMEEFEYFDEETIKKLPKTWFFLTNETISFLYSTIENDPRHHLDLAEFYVVDKKNTLGKTFNSTFICILSALLNSRWKGEMRDVKNTIYINNKSLDEFEITDDLKDIPIHCNKHLIRTFIAQCIHNSLSPIGSHGHRYNNEIKKVDIRISKSKIVIEDSCLISIPKEVKSEQARLFLRKKKYIKIMKCEEYSSTTLTSLQGFVEYMRLAGYSFSCNYKFNRENNFKVSITFNNLTKKK